MMAGWAHAPADIRCHAVNLQDKYTNLFLGEAMSDACCGGALGCASLGQKSRLELAQGLIVLLLQSNRVWAGGPGLLQVRFAQVKRLIAWNTRDVVSLSCTMMRLLSIYPNQHFVTPAAWS